MYHCTDSGSGGQLPSARVIKTPPARILADCIRTSWNCRTIIKKGKWRVSGCAKSPKQVEVVVFFLARCCPKRADIHCYFSLL